MTTRQRVGVSPDFKAGFHSLPFDLRKHVMQLATFDYERTMANRIRTAYRIFRRRAGVTLWGWIERKYVRIIDVRREIS